MTLEISPTSWTRQLTAQLNQQSKQPEALPRVRGKSTLEHVATDTKRGENPNTLVAEIGDGTDAINFLLVAGGCPAHLRPLIDCIVGLAGDRVGWFEADDLNVGSRARAGFNDMSGDAARKWVQRWRKALIEWQQSKDLALIECSPGGQAPDGTRYPSRYKVNLLALAAAVVEKARNSEFWRRNPSRALMVAAEEIIEDAPVTDPYKPRFRKPRRDDDAVLRRNPKHAETLLSDVARIMTERGEDFPTWFDSYVERIRQATNVHIKQEKQWTDFSGGEAGESQGGDAVEVEQMLSVTHREAQMPGQSRQAAVEQMLSEVEQGAADSCTAIEAVTSVGARTFLVTMKDEQTGKATADNVSLAELVGKLPDYMERNASERESFIIRPEGAALIQVDDCTASERDLLAPVSFLVAETSGDNFQAWLALPTTTSDDERKRIRERLFTGALLGTPANVGAGNAMRWVGSLNCKPERRRADGSFPRVRLVASSFGRYTTEAELESYGLLAPPCDSFSPVKHEKAVDKSVPRTPPSYERCLQSVRVKENGKPDRSDADLLFCVTCFDWGFSLAETSALLKRVSGKARVRRDDYVQRTVTMAFNKATAKERRRT